MDFIPGDVLETRRGGVDVLRILAQELATLERHGSIKIIRNIPEVGQRIGHLLVYDGTLAAAFHDWGFRLVNTCHRRAFANTICIFNKKTKNREAVFFLLFSIKMSKNRIYN